MKSRLTTGMLVAALLELIGGCQPRSTLRTRDPSDDELVESFHARQERIVERMRSELVWVSCADAPPKRRACGRILDDLLTPEAAKAFVASHCADPHVRCGPLLDAGARRRFRERYRLAVEAEVNLRCGAEGCPTILEEEGEWLHSHNDHAGTNAKRALFLAMRAHLDALERARATREERENQAASGLGAMDVVAALLLGLARAGSSPAKPEHAGPTEVLSERAGDCSSDFACGYGRRCVKPEYRATGTCADVVNEYGRKVPARPRFDSVGVGGRGDCRFNTDCPVGFRCEKGGTISGNCMK